MNKMFFIPAVCAALVLSSCGGSSKVEESGKVAEASAVALTYEIDSASSNVAWLAKKVGGQHSGTVAIKSGKLQADSGMISAGNFVLDMTSVAVTDIPASEEGNGKLVGHLKSEDFFSVEKNPMANFDIVSVEPIAGAAAGAANFTVKGNLTIKGISKAITFPATIDMTSEMVSAKATFEIDRTEWDIKFLSGKFFKDLGDKVIYDNFQISFDLKAKVKIA